MLEMIRLICIVEQLEKHCFCPNLCILSPYCVSHGILLLAESCSNIP